MSKFGIAVLVSAVLAAPMARAKAEDHAGVGARATVAVAASDNPPTQPTIAYVTENRSLVSGGITRNFLLARPATITPGVAMPIIFSLHGDGGTGAGMRNALALEAQSTRDTLFVYPTAPGNTFEYYTYDGRTREAAFVSAVIVALAVDFNVDTDLVFIAGFSGGATMANALGCRLGAGVIRGLGIHSGSLYPIDDGNGVPDFTYTNNGGVSCDLPATIFVWGRNDNTAGVSFATGQAVRDNYLATQDCASTTTVSPIAPCGSYDACARAVAWCPIDNMGHSIWTGAGTQNPGSAAAAMWQFFLAAMGGGTGGDGVFASGFESP